MKLRRKQQPSAPAVTPENQTFVCNICGTGSTTPLEQLSRETPDCTCGSTPRFRAVVSVLTQELFGKPMKLSEIPESKDLKGVGFTDWPGYAGSLAAKLDYQNTYLTRSPKLDITSPQPHYAGSCDFVIASEVFEHVRPPVEEGLRNVRNMLKPKGFLLITVPFRPNGPTQEHYPNLYDYEVVQFRGRSVLLNRTASGGWEVFENPASHGGEGLALEMRVFSRDGLVSSLHDAGFGDVRVVTGAPEFGASWSETWSLPVVARR